MKNDIITTRARLARNPLLVLHEAINVRRPENGFITAAWITAAWIEAGWTGQPDYQRSASQAQDTP